MLMTLPRRGVTLWITIAVIIILIYIPLNIIYILSTPLQNKAPGSLQNPQQSSLSLTLKQSGELLKMQDFNLRNDGTVDLRVNVNLVDMIKLLNAYTDRSFGGQMTTNPLPINFTFVVPNAKVCDGIPDLQALIYIHSAPSNFARRKIIRSTWADSKLFTDFSMRRVFLMGRPKGDKDREIIDSENKEHQDMVVGDFDDNYKNLTLKAIMGLKWTALNCPQARYVIKADDDAFVNIFELRKIMKSNEKKKDLLICPLWKENTMPILRDPSKCMKWCVRFNEFPGRTHFPKYCAGLAYIMSQNIVPKLYTASLSTPFFWIDDVYVSGMLGPKVKGLEYVDLLKNFTLKENLAADEYLKPSAVKVTYYFAHVKTAATFHKMWNATLHRLSSSELGNLGEHVLKDYSLLKDKQSAR